MHLVCTCHCKQLFPCRGSLCRGTKKKIKSKWKDASFRALTLWHHIDSELHQRIPQATDAAELKQKLETLLEVLKSAMRKALGRSKVQTSKALEAVMRKHFRVEMEEHEEEVPIAGTEDTAPQCVPLRFVASPPVHSGCTIMLAAVGHVPVLVIHRTACLQALPTSLRCIYDSTLEGVI